MRASPYIKPLEKETMEWEALLVRLQVSPTRYWPTSEIRQILCAILALPNMLYAFTESSAGTSVAPWNISCEDIIGKGVMLGVASAMNT
jgi:hypothetical protein